MWLFQNFDYLSTGVLGSVLVIFFLYQCKVWWKKSKIADDTIIYVITDAVLCEKACARLKSHCEDLPALGFDCEWVNEGGVRKPVALLQLASPYGLRCLFRLNILIEIPPKLREILTDPKIIKTGVAPLNDSKLLLHDYDVQVQSTLDLRHLYPSGGSLASLAQKTIGLKLNKSWWLQCSNWECPKLSLDQIIYAANDAVAGIEIFKQWLLDQQTFSNIKHQKNLSNVQLCKKSLDQLKPFITRFLDIHFKGNQSAMKSKKEVVLESYSSNVDKKQKSVFVTRKSPLYENCFMHAPDGELLCSCDKRKAEWYVERGLAEVLPGEGFSIRLLFEPAARAEEGNCGRYYQQLKKNCCVVCGASQSYLRHNVVPKEYRKYFPNIMKDHQSHDILLMCVRCHSLASQHNENLRQRLAVICDAPINSSKVTQVKPIQNIQKCAKALLTSGDKIPLKRKLFLENEVKKFYNVESITVDLLKQTASLDSRVVENSNYESHGFKVVSYFAKFNGTSGLMILEKLWRKHFLLKMNPQYMPAFWSVTHNHSRLSP